MALRDERRGEEKEERVTSPVADGELKLSVSCSCGNMKREGVVDHVQKTECDLKKPKNLQRK